MQNREVKLLRNIIVSVNFPRLILHSSREQSLAVFWLYSLPPMFHDLITDDSYFEIFLLDLKFIFSALFLINISFW